MFVLRLRVRWVPVRQYSYSCTYIRLFVNDWIWIWLLCSLYAMQNPYQHETAQFGETITRSSSLGSSGMTKPSGQYGWPPTNAIEVKAATRSGNGAKHVDIRDSIRAPSPYKVVSTLSTPTPSRRGLRYYRIFGSKRPPSLVLALSSPCFRESGEIALNRLFRGTRLCNLRSVRNDCCNSWVLSFPHFLCFDMCISNDATQRTLKAI
jgi:hypothetical protein